MSSRSAITSPRVDPGAELDPFFRRGSRVPLCHPPLHLRGAPDGVDDAGELGKEAVAGVLYNPAPVLGDLRIDQLPEVPFEPFVRPLLIRPHQTRIAQVPGPLAKAQIAEGRLQALLTPFAVITLGVFLYYPGKRQVLPKLRAFIEHVKYRSTEAPHDATTARNLRKLNSANS
jgi:DNA-binding transcriptional LysR family regulator